MRRISVLALALFSGAILCASVQAQTQSNQQKSRVQRAAAAAELTVTKKSWLEPGNVAPVGTMDRYVQTVKYPTNPAPGGTYRNDNFGDWLLPQYFGVPGFQR
jgi:hypothetical protein